MRVISRKTLREFWDNHADAEQALKSWHDEVRKVRWRTLNDIKAMYSSASFLANERVVFNIRGNNYRVVTVVKLNIATVYIRFIGTHSMYDKINAEKI